MKSPYADSNPKVWLKVAISKEDRDFLISQSPEHGTLNAVTGRLLKGMIDELRFTKDLQLTLTRRTGPVPCSNPPPGHNTRGAGAKDPGQKKRPNYTAAKEG